MNIFKLIAVFLIILVFLALIAYEAVTTLKLVTTYKDTLIRIKDKAIKKIEVSNALALKSKNINISPKYALRIYKTEFKNSIHTIETNLKNINFYTFLLAATVIGVLVFGTEDFSNIFNYATSGLLSILQDGGDIFSFIQGLNEKSVAKFGVPCIAIQVLIKPLLQLSAQKEISRHQECVNWIDDLIGFMD